MANNRMYLVHVPSGLAVYLGKTMGDEWYFSKDEQVAAVGTDLVRLYRVVFEEYGGSQDFTVAMESLLGVSKTGLATDKWRFTEVRRDDGLVQLEMMIGD
jgi:hypothetical protein